MTVAGIVKSSLVDYPGLVACVLFLPGCNYNCFYCHNRSLLDGTAETLPPEEIESFLKKRAGQLDGAVLSGGEPTVHPDLAEFMRSIRELGYKLKLDTNGSRPAVVRALLAEGLFDYCAVDYKAPAARYEEICGPGADAEPTRETVSLLLASGLPFEVRTTVIPQLGEENLVQMARELPQVPRFVLNPYRKPERYLPADGPRVSLPPHAAAELERFARSMRPFQPNIVL